MRVMATRAKIVFVDDLPGTHWRLPWLLLVLDLCGWRPLGRYPSRSGARSAAERRGLKVEEK